MPDFRKAFFPTEEEKLIQNELLEKLHNENVQDYIDKGFSKLEAEEQIENEIEEYKTSMESRGYYK